jgi:hypothetical protein
MPGGMTGRSLRDGLRGHGVKKSGPSFYQLMSRMEDAGLVKGWYEQQIVESQIIRERHYKLLAAGRKAWRLSRDFYAQAVGRAGAEGLAIG